MRSTGDGLLAIQRVSHAFDGVQALEGVDLTVRPGTVSALIGPNGAGKTTLFGVVSGFIRPDSGRVLLGGTDVTGWPADQVARSGVGRLFQDVRPLARMSVLENVLVGCADQPAESLARCVFQPRHAWRTDRANRDAALSLLRRFELDNRAQAWAGQLSYGQQKLLAIARLLANGCRVLLLDEPTAGVSGRMREVLSMTIRALAAEGHTILLIEHNLTIAFDLASVAYLLHRGKVVAAGEASDIKLSSVLRDVYSGRA